MTSRSRIARAALLPLLAACTHHATPVGREAAASPSPVLFTCAAAIDTDASPDGLRVVLGVVALPASPGHAALQTARTGERGPTRLFAKTGLVVRRGATVQLLLPAAVAGRARIGWGDPGTPAGRVDVPGCSPAGSGQWLAYAGGYWVDRPACLPVLVRTGGHEQRVEVGLGTPCRGEQPPPTPTDR